MATGWEDLDLEVLGEGRFATDISATWRLVSVPQGGVVAAIAVRAMQHALGDRDQTLRTLTAMFAGQVACGPVVVEVEVLRRGRSMSQLMATVKNQGSQAGLTAIAAFGAPRRGFDFTELTYPDVPGPDGVRSFRDPLPEGVDFEPHRPPMPFWEEVVEARPVIGRAPWVPFEDGPAETALWYRLDHPPLSGDGSLDVAGVVVACDTMPGSVGVKIPPGGDPWFAPSVDYTLHVFAPAPAGWLLAHQRARHAGDGYASVDVALWDASDEPRLVAYATQVMVFAFGR